LVIVPTVEITFVFGAKIIYPVCAVKLLPPDPPSQITLKCPYCPQRFHLNYSGAEWNRVTHL